MNEIELAEKIKAMREATKAIVEAAEREEQDLIVKWNKENSPVKVGDVIKNRLGISIKVEKIRVGFGRQIEDVDICCCIYYGSLVMINGKPYKKPSDLALHQSKVTEINGVPYAMEQD